MTLVFFSFVFLRNNKVVITNTTLVFFFSFLFLFEIRKWCLFFYVIGAYVVYLRYVTGIIVYYFYYFINVTII